MTNEFVNCPECGADANMTGMKQFLSGALRADDSVKVCASRIDWYCDICGEFIVSTDANGKPF